jgi:hypothetical protein
VLHSGQGRKTDGRLSSIRGLLGSAGICAPAAVQTGSHGDLDWRTLDALDSPPALRRAAMGDVARGWRGSASASTKHFLPSTT